MNNDEDMQNMVAMIQQATAPALRLQQASTQAEMLLQYVQVAEITGMMLRDVDAGVGYNGTALSEIHTYAVKKAHELVNLPKSAAEAEAK